MEMTPTTITVTSSTKVFYALIVSTFAWITAYLNIDGEMLTLYFVLLFVDLLTGTMAAFISREIMTQTRFLAGLLSKLLMFIIPIVVAIIAKMQGNDLLWFIKWTLIVLAVSEAISIFNNVLKSKGKTPLPEFDAIALISVKLRSILERLFNTAGGDK